MNRPRRSFLAFASLGAFVASGLGKAGRAYAATWNKQGFEAKAYTDALKGIGATNATDSKDITITAPDIAENGAVVPVAITSKIPNTQSISIVAEKNPFPLVATFEFTSAVDPYASVRIKMGQTSNVYALVKTADGKFYRAAKEVKVTVGGCG